MGWNNLVQNQYLTCTEDTTCQMHTLLGSKPVNSKKCKNGMEHMTNFFLPLSHTCKFPNNLYQT